MSLYDEIGGQPAIDAAVRDFWNRITTDAVLAPLFSEADPNSHSGQLSAYLAVALDGPENYQGRSMRHAHTGMRVSPEAFELVIERMSEALFSVGASAHSVANVVARLSALRPVIIEL
jgi:hemoglobin